uniref:Uncharacterized protein n=1 Tax=Lepeophtheirus salmonis TaxID=72036 RepID=A0A0K2TIQ0_LEPSM
MRLDTPKEVHSSRRGNTLSRSAIVTCPVYKKLTIICTWMYLTLGRMMRESSDSAISKPLLMRICLRKVECEARMDL